jgi:cellulose synthase/poly-beta-1,6-N-acetylglucosamine synthase-like glycosyltransferase
VTIIAVFLFLLALPVLFWAAYLAALTVLSQRPPEPDYGPPKLKFAVVIPAHDEEAGIETAVRSLQLLDYPPELFHVVVVADNCTDHTADKALHVGAAVLVRKDPEKRGKGHALKYAFDILLEGDEAPDAFVIIDADTSAAPNMLRAFAARLEAGEVAVQAEYSVRNPDASWRTRLMVIALALFHAVRSLARERLGVSVGLRGNGMALSAKVVKEVPHDAFSLVEDLEYGIRLGQAGHRVAYAHDALVVGDMASREQGARSQRHRWEAGRFQMAKQYLIPLLREAYKTKSKLLLDLAMDLIVPPLSIVATAAFAGAVLSLALTSWAWIPWMLSIGCIAVYVVRGVIVSGAGWRGFVDLAYAPVYVGWKLTLPLTSKKDKDWVRTEREKP